MTNNRDNSGNPAAPASAAVTHALETGSDPEVQAPACCAGGPPEAGTDPVPPAAGVCCAERLPAAGGTAREKFGAFMNEVNCGGSLSAREKELMALALSILSKCEPCVKIHLKKAVEAGLTEAEIEEAVWMAISFGGAPTMMWYNGVPGK